MDRSLKTLLVASAPLALMAMFLAAPLVAHPGAKSAEQRQQAQQEETKDRSAKATSLTLKDVADNAEWRVKAAKSLN
jgi:multisubunit Na+/H+ antiporter MnhG subunit